MNEHETFDALAAVYALGALDGDDLARFEAHLAAGCERCAATLRESDEALARLALGGTPAIPPPHVKQALLARIDAAGARRAGARRTVWRWAVAAALAVVAGSALTGGFVAGRYEARLGFMARETARVKAELLKSETALREQVAFYQGVVDLLREPGTRVVDLRGLGPSPKASARVVWNETRGGHLFVTGLDPAPAGKVYELWTIAGQVPRPAGLFSVDAAGRASRRVEAPPAGPPVRVFAVTLEPEGGVPAPTGPMVLASATK